MNSLLSPNELSELHYLIDILVYTPTAWKQLKQITKMFQRKGVDYLQTCLSKWQGILFDEFSVFTQNNEIKQRSIIISNIIKRDKALGLAVKLAFENRQVCIAGNRRSNSRAFR